MSNSYSEINYNGDKDVQSTQIVIKDDLGKIYMRENEKETERDMTPDEINAVLKGNPLKLTKKTTKKKNKKSIKKKKGGVRKHKGIIQTGGNAGRLQKGYKYSGKKLKNGLPKIIKCKSKKSKSRKLSNFFFAV
jgi:hypothetical protein